MILVLSLHSKDHHLQVLRPTRDEQGDLIQLLHGYHPHITQLQSHCHVLTDLEYPLNLVYVPWSSYNLVRERLLQLLQEEFHMANIAPNR